MLWTSHSDRHFFHVQRLRFGICFSFKRRGCGKKLNRPSFDNNSFLFDFGVTASLQVLPPRQFYDDPIFRREYEDINICGCECLDIEHGADRTGHGVVLKHTICNHLVDNGEGLFGLQAHFAISASISSRSFGTLCVSTRAPFSVTSTSSSMRTPMPRYFAGMSLLKPSGMRLVSGEM